MRDLLLPAGRPYTSVSHLSPTLSASLSVRPRRPVFSTLNKPLGQTHCEQNAEPLKNQC